MACDCIEKIERDLAEHTLETGIMLRSGTMTAETYSGLVRRDNGKIETRSKKPRYFAHSYCPFCGAKYREEAA